MSRIKGYLPLIFICLIYTITTIFIISITNQSKANEIGKPIDAQSVYEIMYELDSNEEESQRIFDNIEVPKELYDSMFEKAKNSLYYVNTDQGKTMVDFECKVGETVEINGNNYEILEFRNPTEEELEDYVTYVIKVYLYQDALASEAIKIYSERDN